MGSKGGSTSASMSGIHTSVISHNESRRRRHGEPVIIQRQIFFEGVVYLIEEEIYSDKDNSSVYTSEDEFAEETGVQKRFKRINPIDDAGSHKSANLLRSFEAEEKAEGESRSKGSKGSTPGTAEEGKTSSGLMKTALKQSPAKDGGEAGDSKRRVSISVPAKGADARKASIKKGPEKKRPVKSFSKDKQASHQEVFVNSPNLTEDQKRYEGRIGSKAYNPAQADKRHDMVDARLAPKRAAPVGRRLDGTSSPLKSATPEPALHDTDIMCVTSFNDWMPARMKTLRRLNLERFATDLPDEEVPRSVFRLDNEVALCAQMVPPGYHYFYFVKQQGAIFLSPNYEVVRFKSTNIFLNRIFVTKRLEDVETVHVAKAGAEEEAVFMKERSVFRTYREDTQAYLRSCFEEDFQFGKIPRTVKKGAEHDKEVDKIKDLLFMHYV